MLTGKKLGRAKKKSKKAEKRWKRREALRRCLRGDRKLRRGGTGKKVELRWEGCPKENSGRGSWEELRRADFKKFAAAE